MTLYSCMLQHFATLYINLKFCLLFLGVESIQFGCFFLLYKHSSLLVFKFRLGVFLEPVANVFTKVFVRFLLQGKKLILYFILENYKNK